MAKIKLHRPDQQTAPGEAIDLAPRQKLGAGAVLGLVDNGKPKARELLTYLGEELQRRLPIEDVFLLSKPSAAKPIDADQARMMAARSRMVVTGLGD
jgi:hypothetical protein